MRVLKLPNVAQEVAQALYKNRQGSPNVWLPMLLNATAPLIVAAELRQLAAEWEDSHPFERATRLHDRANELDPNNPS
jgi:hypothetical protein